MKVSNLSKNADDFTGNIWYLENSEDVLIDAGTGDSWQSVKNLEKIDKVVVTHSHHDHVENLAKIVEMFGPEVYAYEPENLDVEAEEIRDGDQVRICGELFEVIHTPGHRDDSICLYSPESGKLFTGDLLFPDGGFGRTDLDEGDREKLIESIENISRLQVDSFYPGHGESVVEEAESSIEKSLQEARRREPKY